MPVYDFECPKCNERFFEIIKPDEVDKIKCPKCKGEVKRIYEGKFHGKFAGEGGCGGSCSGCSCCRG